MPFVARCQAQGKICLQLTLTGIIFQRLCLIRCLCSDLVYLSCCRGHSCPKSVRCLSGCEYLVVAVLHGTSVLRFPVIWQTIPSAQQTSEKVSPPFSINMRLITAIVGGLAFSSYYIDAAPVQKQDIFGHYDILSMQIFTPSTRPEGPKNLGIRFGIYDPNPLAAPHHYGVCKAEFPMPSAGEVQRITGKIVSAVIARNLLPKPLRLILSRMPCAGTTFRFHFARFQSISDFSLEANHEITDPRYAAPRAELIMLTRACPSLFGSRPGNRISQRAIGEVTETNMTCVQADSGLRSCNLRRDKTIRLHVFGYAPS